MSEDKIRELAYLKWESAGYPQSDGVKYWLQAEEELIVRSPKSYKSSAQPQIRVAAKVSSKKK